MNKETKRRIRILLFGVVCMLLLLVGISYATFSTDLEGTKVQGIKAGCLKVEMADNGNLHFTNQAPQSDASGLAKAPYVYTLTNTCNTDAFYMTTINVLDTSTVDNEKKVKVALDGDSYLAPIIEDELQQVELVDQSETGIYKTYKLDEGFLNAGDSKTFELRTWIDYDVESITGGIENKIIVISEARGEQGIAYNTNTAAFQVLKKTPVINDADYSDIAPSDGQVSGIVKIKTADGIKYYFRGNPDNHLTFAGENFRIVSTNPDGSINIVLDRLLSSVAYANVQTSLNSFYSTISSEEDYIKTDATFCIDNDSKYLAKVKVDNTNPTGVCESGNKMTKVGLLTSDDLMFAGGKAGVANTSFYLSASGSYYTNSYQASNMVYRYTTGNSIVGVSTGTANGIKPVITLKNTTLIYGEGTSAKPYYVSGTYEAAEENYKDSIAPTIAFARVDERWSNQNKHIEISAKDDADGSGIAGYLISSSSSKPSLSNTSWEASSMVKHVSVNTYGNGAYYVFVKDNAGNISDGLLVRVERIDKTNPTCTIHISPNGSAAPVKTLSILSDDNNIDLEGYSWDHISSKEDVIKVEANGVYTAYIKDLAGNQGSCSATISNVVG